jgi:hypothetical protein
MGAPAAASSMISIGGFAVSSARAPVGKDWGEEAARLGAAERDFHPRHDARMRGVPARTHMDTDRRHHGHLGLTIRHHADEFALSLIL